MAKRILPIAAGATTLLLCLAYPPWIETGNWKLKNTGEPVDSNIGGRLDSFYFGKIPHTYGWYWSPPAYKTTPGSLALTPAPAAPTYTLENEDITLRVYGGFLFFQSVVVVVATTVLAAGLTRLKWRSYEAWKGVIATATLLICAWFAFLGFYFNLVRIRSGLFSVSTAGLIMLLLGIVGAGSAIWLLRFPRTAGFAAFVSTIGLALTGTFGLVKNALSANISLTGVLLLCLMYGLAIAIYLLFCRGCMLSARRDTDD